MSELRPIVPLSKESMRGVTPKSPGPIPTIEWVDPKTLFVEDDYQRTITAENSTALIREIVGQFDWSHFKLPICCRVDGCLVTIDGQHTATAGATHPDVPLIPVLVVDGVDMKARAQAFVGHNTRRLGLTQMAIFHAEIAAGDPAALIAKRACESAGATILEKSINLREKAPIGATIAIGTIRSLAKKHGEKYLAEVMSVLVDAKRGPVKAGEIGAVAMIYSGTMKPWAEVRPKLVATIASKTAEKWNAIAASESADSKLSIGPAIASVWCRAMDVRLGKSLSKEALPKAAPKPPAAPTRPLTEGMVRKGGHNQGPSQVAVRPPPPAPMVKVTPPVVLQPKPSRIEPVLASANGIAVHLSEIVRNETRLRIEPKESTLLRRLVSVMPAQLPADRLAASVFQDVRGNAVERIEILAKQLNPQLRALGLEVFQASRGWFNLRDVA